MEQNNQLTQIDVDSLPVNHDAFTKDLAKWHQVGSESVTVPAGTFSCDHWAKDDGSGDIWVSSQVAPMGMVKSVDKNDTTVLVIGGAILAQRTANFEAIHPRQHHIENHDVEGVVARIGKPLVAGRRDVCRPPGFSQGVRDKFRDVVVVFDNEDMHHQLRDSEQ